MNSKGFSAKIDKRISEMAEGIPFVANDFSDITNVRIIRELLNRRVRAGTLRRVMPGIYIKPKINRLLNIEVPVNPETLAQAIARNHKWTIAPNEQAALNAIGLSTQVPAIWKFTSDGPYISYNIDGIILKFMHTANKNISAMSPTSCLVVQAIKALGKNKLSAEDLKKISSRLSQEEIEQLFNDTSQTTAWIRDAIREIVQMKVG